MTDTSKSTIGVDLGGTKLLIVSDERVEQFETGPRFSPEDFVSKLKVFFALESKRASHLGIAIPGLVDGAGTVVACDVLPALVGWRPADMLKEFACRVTVMNDVKAALLEETHDLPVNITGGVVMAGTAIGAAFVANGKPLLGSSGWAGELGYLPVLIDSQVKRLDEIAGGAAIAARRRIAPEKLRATALAGDPASLAVIAEGGAALGVGLAAVVNLFNPSHLFVGGGTLELPGYWEAAIAIAKRHSIPQLWEDCELGKVKAGARVVALGARRAVEVCAS